MNMLPYVLCAIPLALVCFALGLIACFQPDVWWTMHRHRYEREGIDAKRNHRWDTNAKIHGIVLLALGIVLLYGIYQQYLADQALMDLIESIGRPLTEQ
jgi:hypothetical protein